MGLRRWLVERFGSEESNDGSVEASSATKVENRIGDIIDLADQWELTFCLLDDTRLWKDRAVHEIVLRDSDHVNVSTSYQVRLPLELVHKFEPSARSGDLVRLLLPFSVRPKQLLLDVDFKGPNSRAASLVLRQENAELQALYIERVAGRLFNDEPLGHALWLGVCSFTVAAWRASLDETKPTIASLRSRSRKNRRWRVRALVSYLESDLRLGVTTHDVERWLDVTEPARQQLVSALGEGDDPDSASECVLLAVPFMPARPARVDDIDILVNEFVAVVAEMDESGRQVLAEYGRRWEVILDTIVPVGQVCQISLSEQRPWVDTPSPVMRQELAWGDATTTHVEVRAADHGVVLDHLEISDLVGERVGFAVGDSARKTADAMAIYASDAERPYFARIGVRVRVRRGQRLTILWLLVLISLAGLVAVSLPEDQNLVDALALLTFPLTLAGAVVLTREATSLAERLLRRWRGVLVLSIAALWFVTLSRLLLNANVDLAESAWSGARRAFCSAVTRLC